MGSDGPETGCAGPETGMALAAIVGFGRIAAYWRVGIRTGEPALVVLRPWTLG